MTTRVKFCGFTRKQDITAAVESGVDALGFVFYDKSPRAVTIAQAVSLIKYVPPFVTTVGLFVNPTNEQVNAAIKQCRLDLLQFHGSEDAAFCMQFDRPYIKAIAMGDSPRIGSWEEEHPAATGFLLDSHASGEQGGSGKKFDWTQAIGQLNKPIILAGGITPNNVTAAITQLAPYAVDVSSGIEHSKGIKDADKMTALMNQVRNT